MQHVRFAVDTKPYCLWDPELARIEREFIDQLDSDYFSFLAEAYAPRPNEEGPGQRAALALRAAYAHATETFLAFLFAAMQAPDCTMGWMHLYRRDDVRALIRKVDNQEQILAKSMPSPVTWDRLAETVLTSLVLDDKEKESRIKRKFGNLWRHVAREFSRQNTLDEYDSVKHGLRVHGGGFSLAFGIEDRPGEPARPDRMRSLGGSEYGSSYFRLRPIEGRRHKGVERHSRNWRIEESYAGLILLSQSIENLKSFIKIAIHRDDPSSVRFVWPSDDSLFDAMVEPLMAPTDFSTASIVEVGDIRAYSKEEILAVYGQGKIEPQDLNGT